MEIKKENNILFITLPAECVISKIEADTDRLKTFISQERDQSYKIKDFSHVKKIEIKAHAVEQMDTAYLQLLLSLKTTADQLGISLSYSEIPDEMLRICELYGVKEVKEVRSEK